MSPDVAVAWDRPAAAGDGEHWLWVTLAGLAPASRARSLVVLVDTSRSMVGSRLDRARESIVAVVQACSSQDRVLIVSFGSSAASLGEFDGGADVSGVLSELVAAGSTRLDLAFDEAERWLGTQGGVPHIVVMTDGDPTGADGRRAATTGFIERARDLGARGVRFIVVGLGSTDGYDASFLRGLADAGGGVACVGVSPERLVQRTVAGLRAGFADASEATAVLRSTELSLLEAWRVDPRVQPLAVRDGRLTMPVGDSGSLLLRCRLTLGLGARRGTREVGTLEVTGRGGVPVPVPLVLQVVPPGSPDRMALYDQVDELRVKVELARTAQLRAGADDWDDQVRLTRQLAGLVDQLGDPRATRRVQADLSKLEAGATLTRTERDVAVDVLRGGTDDG